MAQYLLTYRKPSPRFARHHHEDKKIHDINDISHVFISGKYRELNDFKINILKKYKKNLHFLNFIFLIYLILYYLHFMLYNIHT
jgi:hypothetical protein